VSRARRAGPGGALRELQRTPADFAASASLLFESVTGTAWARSAPSQAQPGRGQLRAELPEVAACHSSAVRSCSCQRHCCCVSDVESHTQYESRYNLAGSRNLAVCLGRPGSGPQQEQCQQQIGIMPICQAGMLLQDSKLSQPSWLHDGRGTPYVLAATDPDTVAHCMTP
jgi:hypothetical protein